jgi:hypothetical protein
MVVTRTALGKEGERVSVRNVIANHNEPKTPPNYLHPAADAELGQ